MSGQPTPLFEEHRRLNGKMVDYAGWILPVQYSGISAEHLAVRKMAGLFDVSHMGEIEIMGPDAAGFADFLLPRGLKAMQPGRAYYSPMCQADGGTVDDLIVYPLAADHLILVVNAANTAKDYSHICAVAALWAGMGGTLLQITDRSADFAQLALQGPAAASLIGGIFPESASLKPYHYVEPENHAGTLLSRTGYTGEDGFEIYLPPEAAPLLWRRLIELGAVPAGLGARDSLRLEAGMPLYGHELAPDITPLEAGLARFVDLEKTSPGFVGQQALRQTPPGRRLVGLISQGRAIPRAGYPVICDGKTAGLITSGGFSPSLNVGIGLALLENFADNENLKISVLVREREEPFAVSPLPFVRRSDKT